MDSIKIGNTIFKVVDKRRSAWRRGDNKHDQPGEMTNEQFFSSNIPGAFFEGCYWLENAGWVQEIDVNTLEQNCYEH